MGTSPTGPSLSSKTKGIYAYPIEDRQRIYNQCNSMAKVFSQQPDKRMLVAATESKNTNLKIAGALYWGIVNETDEMLFKAIEDPNPFVAHAAYESCHNIAKSKYGETYPFDSTHDCDAEMKDSVMYMSKLYFENLKLKQDKKPVTKKPEKKDVRQILGLGPND
jgi:hypothetical protein